MANASLEILLNPSMLIQAEHNRFLLIPLAFTWFETASLTTVLLSVYLIPFQLEEIHRYRKTVSEFLNHGKDSTHSVLEKLCESAL